MNLARVLSSRLPLNTLRNTPIVQLSKHGKTDKSSYYLSKRNASSSNRPSVKEDVLSLLPDTIDSKIGLVSTSNCIYHNLALEDYIYSKASFTDRGCILLIWLDDPCVVIGRHQNPWAELITNHCKRKNITIARRSSGGGTVYHDKGNINFSFMTNRKCYDRKKNLSLLCDHLNQLPNVNCFISPREDIVTNITRDGSPVVAKVSGTAAKLSSKNAYHHCTLLVNSDLNQLRACLRKSLPESFVNRATSSVPSPIVNVSSLVGKDETVTTRSIVDSFMQSFTPDAFEISPDEKTVPLINDKVHNFSSWNWIYGKTPKFTLKREFNSEADPFSIEINVNHGLIDSVLIVSLEKASYKFKLEGERFDTDQLKDHLLLWSITEEDAIWSSNVVEGLDTLLDECIV